MSAQSGTHTVQAAGDHNTNANGIVNNLGPAKIGAYAPGQEQNSSTSDTRSQGADALKNMAGTGNGSYRGQMVQSPPESPVSPASSLKGDNTRMTMPRNSSLDSALSTVTSAAKPSTGASGVTAAEIKNLVTTAGSPENLIVYLLNEKQHAASQNAQLWKLVDKQRSLLLGLNKDLEQVSKDKERYKKKVKELQTQTPIPSFPAAEGNDSSAPSEDDQGGSKTERERNKEKITGKQVATRTPNKVPTAHAESSPMDPSMMPSPLHTLQQQRQSNAPIQVLPNVQPQTNGILPRLAPALTFAKIPVANEDADEVNGRITGASTMSPSDDNPAKRAPEVGRLKTMMMPPAVNLIESSPLVENAEKGFPNTKRPKPAPLNLFQAKRGSMLVHNLQAEDHSDSEYEDLLESDDERGRRKTREDDDREREMVAQKESEARSRSKRGTSAQAIQQPSITKTELTLPKLPVNGLPLSPRPGIPRSFSDEGPSRLLSPPVAGSVAQTGAQEPSNITQQQLTIRARSPGLPTSPRPIDRPLGSPLPRMARDNPGIMNLLPLSPKQMPPGIPLSPRAPRQPITLNNPESIAFPAPPAFNSGKPPMLMTDSAQSDKSKLETSPTSSEQAPHVFRGYVDPSYPHLLLPPNALPSIVVKVASPRLRPSRQSYMAPRPQEEAPVFMLSVYSRHDGKELWRAEKVILALSQLDQQFQTVCKTSARLPDRKLFIGHSPAVMDARRAALDSYFNDLLDTDMNEKAALIICHFLSTDVIEPGTGETNLLAGTGNGSSTLTVGPDGKPRKEGYLTKRGKNFGGWKARFFVLRGTDLRYFEAPGGAHLGTIKLVNAQIGKQSSSDTSAQGDEDAENQYRHAFLILEPKRKDSTSLVKHVLCAESDRERDEWVAALLHYVDDPSEDDSTTKPHNIRTDSEKSRTARLEAKVKMYASSMTGSAKEDATSDNAGAENLKAINYADTATGSTPLKRAAAQAMERQNETPSPTSTSSATTPHSAHQTENEQQQGTVASKTISSPTNGGVIQDVEAWGNKPATASNFKENYHKKRGLWNFRQKSSTDLSAHEQPHSTDSNANQAQSSAPVERRMPARAVFGLPLVEAVELCPPRGVDVNLPAVVYRCLEYLRAKNAASEEGLFRLSGSNVVIRALKERFNVEGDVDLLGEGQYHDVHAVASLFKTYLRELPSTVLTRELHIEFLKVLEVEEKNDRIVALNTLVHRLPPVNFSLLRVLSQYLLEVVNNSDKNKMGVRNVGIVFAPTLNIAAPIFAAFLTDFDAIFNSDEVPEVQTRTVELNVPGNLSPVDIRSPRRQMFSDLPTPGYNQTSFANGAPANSYATQPNTAMQYTAVNEDSTQEVGFSPMKPSYESRHYNPKPTVHHPAQQRYSVAQPPPSSAQAEYGSLNMMMVPENAPTLKAKRRESSMLFM